MFKSKSMIAAALILAFPTLGSAANYTIDSDHTYPSLEMTHMGLSIWRGKFNKTTGKVTLDRAAKTGSADIQIDTASIDFGHEKMNEHAVAEDWLNAQKFPTMTYKGALKFKGDMPESMDGQLTMRGITKPVKLKINSFKCMEHPMLKKEVCGADAEGVLNRADFGMTKYSEGEAGKIYMRIQVEALRDN